MFIFFFISFSLLYTFNPQQQSKIKVNLPKGMTVEKMIGENPVIIVVTAKNEIFIGDRRIPEKSLMNELAKYSGEASKNGALVKADKDASVDYFVKVLDSAKQAGINKLSVSIELIKEK
jgi:biopolymer transport protein ExbD